MMICLLISIHRFIVSTDIGGLDNVLESLKEAVIYPLTLPHLFKQGGELLGPPKG
jgi:SpoVK/Ycf46/Vps4 family AAA+-type ATPase